MSHFPKKDPHKTYGWFGYEGAMCDRAIAADNAEMVAEAVERGWISQASEDMNGASIVAHCERKGKHKCAAKLRELGLT